MPILRFVSTVQGTDTIELEDPIITIGRGINNSVCIEDPNISKHHALLIKEEDGYKIIDLHSVNGSAVNGQRLTVAKLKAGDAVRIGFLEMTYLVVAPALASTPPPANMNQTITGAPPAAAPSQPRPGFGGARQPAPPAPVAASEAPAPGLPTPGPVATVQKEKRTIIRLPGPRPLVPPGPEMATVFAPPANPTPPEPPPATPPPAPVAAPEPSVIPESSAPPAEAPAAPVEPAPPAGPKKFGAPPSNAPPLKFRLKRE